MKKKGVLIILDGYGVSKNTRGNAISSARTPELDLLFKTCPNTVLSASGLDVGLPDGQIGNSEVGHTNIGAGRVVYQDLPRISNAIDDGSFFGNPAYVRAMEEARLTQKSLHLIGLLSDGGVHSHNTHLWALLKMAENRGLNRVYIHAFLDGRDVGPKTGAGFMRECVQKCADIGVGRVATVMGRFYAMDRDKRWERVDRAYAAMTRGEGKKEPDPVAAIEDSYRCGITDEFVEPVICDEDGYIKSGDSVIFFNFRPDRARELTYALTQPDFDGFERAGGYIPVSFVCTTQYDESLINLPVAFAAQDITGTLGEYLSLNGLRQLRIAETEKYAHVTFFFNGGREIPFKGEDRVLIPSPKEFPTYDLIPRMSAYEVTEDAEKRIHSGEYDAVILNLANCDMVGHTGVMEAAKTAVETVDTCVGKLIRAALDSGAIAIVTADHGNADEMLATDGTAHTAHTTNPVPFIVAGAEIRLKPGRLADVAPTMLELMGLPQPSEMTGQSLVIN